MVTCLLISKFKTMNKLFILLLLILGLAACHNQDVEFDDFEYTSGYFPYQFPVRTLVLGDYIYDNTNDNNYKFVISVAMGGVYENTKDRTFQFEVDESLCNNILFATDGDTMQALPKEYYSLSSDNTIVIPSGSLNGGVEVQLTDEFFNDPLAIKLGYVLSLKITGASNIDTIMSGKAAVADPDLRVSSDWEEEPLNYTMFAVKYINEYHGTYLHYGESNVSDASGSVIENNTYSEDELVDNSTSDLVTTGRNEVSLSTFLQSDIMTGEITMLLSFDGDDCTITGVEGSSFTISGSGKFKSDAYEWGNKERDGIEIAYTVTDGTNTYSANDVLVIRDRGVVFETYTPEVF